MGARRGEGAGEEESGGGGHTPVSGGRHQPRPSPRRVWGTGARGTREPGGARAATPTSSLPGSAKHAPSTATPHHPDAGQPCSVIKSACGHYLYKH